MEIPIHMLFFPFFLYLVKFSSNFWDSNMNLSSLLLIITLFLNEGNKKRACELEFAHCFLINFTCAKLYFLSSIT